jgi:hydrogenase maturation protease
LLVALADLVFNRTVQTLIVCVGNEHVCDDGIGARVGHVLQTLPLPADVTVELVQRIDLNFLDLVAEMENLIVVDALVGESEPGTCTVVDVSALPAGTIATGCAHAATVSQIVELARHVDCGETLRSVTVAGIERKTSLAYGVGFSAEVVAAVPRLLDLILLSVGARLSTRAMVRDACRSFFVDPDGRLRYLRGRAANDVATGLWH